MNPGDRSRVLFLFLLNYQGQLARAISNDVAELALLFRTFKHKKAYITEIYLTLIAYPFLKFSYI